MKLPNDYQSLKIDLRRLTRPTDEDRIADLQKLVIKRNFKILAPQFPFNSQTKINAECLSCGNTWGISSGKIKAGKGCPRCAGNEKISLACLHKLAQSKNHVILTKRLVNSQQKIKINCETCKVPWTVKATRYKCGPGNCPNCQKRISSAENKRKIKKFYEDFGRLPSRKGLDEERTFYTLLSSYCSRRKNQHDPEFDAWARSKGYGSKTKKWTKVECAILAKLCAHPIDFQKSYRKAYDAARNAGWLEEIRKHMAPIKGKHTYESCKRAVDQCKTIKLLRKRFPGEYGKISTNQGWKDKLFFRFKKRVVCIETGREYKSVADAAQELKVQAANIHAVLKGRRKSAGSYSFRYASDISNGTKRNRFRHPVKDAA